VLDRRGSRAVLCTAVLVNGIALTLLSLTPSLAVFYLLFCIARMNWAGPFDLGIYGAVNNWFVERRAQAASLAVLAQMIGLVTLPLVVQYAIGHGGWRGGWVALGVLTLVAGFVPVWLFVARRPEDLGLAPDGRSINKEGSCTVKTEEPAFSRREAMRTPAFWLLMAYTVLVYPVQAGVSLHQASHFVERGIDAGTAATIVSVFSFMSGVGTLASGFLARRLTLRVVLALIASLMCIAAILMSRIAAAHDGFVAAAIFGFGLGGVLTLLPVAWADYFGRANFGAIRGIALSAQVLAQAAGPLIAGVLRDLTGDYRASLYFFAVLAALSALVALAARHPGNRAPQHAA
jgi:sugar phosphate permease